jgi:ABC-type multidrug transport system ATPase subunit
MSYHTDGMAVRMSGLAKSYGTVRAVRGVDLEIAAGTVGAMLQSGTLLTDVTVSELVDTFAALHRRTLPVPEVLARAGIAELARRRVGRTATCSPRTRSGAWWRCHRSGSSTSPVS